MINFSFGGIGGKVKAAVCSRAFQQGDVVRVPGGSWRHWRHPRGGEGAWAIYLGKSDGKFRVRPLDDKLISQQPVQVGEIEHLDDVEAKLALAMYRQSRDG